MTLLALILTAIIAYVLGRAHGFASAIRHLASLGAAEVDPYVENQREAAPWQ